MAVRLLGQGNGLIQCSFDGGTLGGPGRVKGLRIDPPVDTVEPGQALFLAVGCWFPFQWDTTSTSNLPGYGFNRYTTNVSGTAGALDISTVPGGSSGDGTTVLLGDTAGPDTWAWNWNTSQAVNGIGAWSGDVSSFKGRPMLARIVRGTDQAAMDVPPFQVLTRNPYYLGDVFYAWWLVDNTELVLSGGVGWTGGSRSFNNPTVSSPFGAQGWGQFGVSNVPYTATWPVVAERWKGAQFAPIAPGEALTTEGGTNQPPNPCADVLTFGVLGGIVVEGAAGDNAAEIDWSSGGTEENGPNTYTKSPGVLGVGTTVLLRPNRQTESYPGENDRLIAHRYFTRRVVGADQPTPATMYDGAELGDPFWHPDYGINDPVAAELQVQQLMGEASWPRASYDVQFLGGALGPSETFNRRRRRGFGAIRG